MSEPNTRRAQARFIMLPETRRVSWVPVVLEFTHQFTVACWIGGLVTIAGLVVPGLAGTLRDRNEVAWASLDLVMRMDFVAGGAGAFLLLTTLLMYLLALRTSRATLTQTGLLLGMTLAAVSNHVWVAPGMARLLKTVPDLLTGIDVVARDEFYRLTRVAVFLFSFQIALGASLLFLGVRRWYRYVAPARPDRGILSLVE